MVIGFISCCSTVKKSSDQAENSPILKDLRYLSSEELAGRASGTPGAEKARNFIVERFKKLGIQSFSSNPDYLQSFSFSDQKDSSRQGVNVIGYIPGKIQEAIVISAHYDHLGVRNGNIYYGADDNASGAAALLYFAEKLSESKPNFTIILAAFDAEELGLRGAKAFVQTPPISLDKIKLNVNMDMIAHNDKGELYVCGTYLYPNLKKYIVSRNPQIQFKLGHDLPDSGQDDWTNQSDQGAFHGKGIPFLYFGVEDHADYHQPTDTYEHINPEFYLNATEGILEIIKNIDEQYSSAVQFDKNKMMK